ncbi:MAG: hypothetical protein QM725_09690 [Lacibacter sp.]
MKYIFSISLLLLAVSTFAQNKKTGYVQEQIQVAKSDTVIVATLENYENELRARRSPVGKIQLDDSNGAVINGTFYAGEKMLNRLNNLHPAAISNFEISSNEKMIQKYTSDPKIKKIIFITLNKTKQD